jgi:hypothetical protein
MDGFELVNNVDVSVQTNNFRAPRGRPILLAVLDECAFFRDESSATPDVELYRSLVPGLATIGGQIIGISSPYMKSGLLFDKHKAHFGQDGDDVVVIQAETRKLNPTIAQAVIDQALADDPAAAAAEWLAQFRDDIAGFIPYSIVDDRRAVLRASCAAPPQAVGDRGDGIDREMALAFDAEGFADQLGLGRSREPIETEATLVITVLRETAERQAILDEAPAPRGFPGRDAEQEAGTIGQDVAKLAGDLPVAEPIAAHRALEGARRGVKCGDHGVEVIVIGHLAFLSRSSLQSARNGRWCDCREAARG